jgi:hypothetical protein
MIAEELWQRRPTEPVWVAGPKVINEVPVCRVNSAVSF